MQPKVKICGITTEDDIKILNKYKPEYAGFVFYEKSKRNLTYEKAQKLLSLLSEDIIPVAVVVSPDEAYINMFSDLGFNIMQAHGKLINEIIDIWHGEIWQAVNIAGENMPEVIRHEKVTGYVVDGANYGGGEAFDWDQKQIYQAFSSLKKNSELRILAGGLNLDNLSIGIERFNPEVVDVSTGVEAAIGKDEQKVKVFIEIARNVNY